MSQHDLIYPGVVADYQVGPRWEDDEGSVYSPEDPANAHYWAVYNRPAQHRDKAEWQWVADFLFETDAREYAAWQAKR